MGKNKSNINIDTVDIISADNLAGFAMDIH